MDHTKLFIFSAFLLTLCISCTFTAASPSDSSNSAGLLNTNATIRREDDHQRCETDIECEVGYHCNYKKRCEKCDHEEEWDAVNRKCHEECDWDEEWDHDIEKCVDLPHHHKVTVGVIIALALGIPILIVVSVCLCCCCCAGCAGHSYRERRHQQNQPPQVIVHGYPAPQPYNNNGYYQPNQGQYPPGPGKPQQEKY